MQDKHALVAANDQEAGAVAIAPDQPHEYQPLDARAHMGDGDTAAQEAGAMPAAEAFAHAIAATAHQHAAATPEDTPRSAKLPFPRPPFDLVKAFLRINEKDAEVTTLMVEAQRADNAAKGAAERKKAANEALNSAYVELHELIRHYRDEQAAADDPEQLKLHEAGRQPCSWELKHPGEVCHICSTGGAHETNGGGPGPMPRNDQSLRDAILMLVITDPTVTIPEERVALDTMATWSDETYRQVQGWTAAKELAKTEPNVVVPPMPVVIGGHHAEDDEYGLVEDEHGDEDDDPFEPGDEDGDLHSGVVEQDDEDDEVAEVDPVVGGMCVAVQKTGVCNEGERGVCYERYEINDRLGFSFIFESGRYDGFSPAEVRRFLRLTGVCEALTGYRFTSVSKLTRDLRKGVFAPALKVGP